MYLTLLLCSYFYQGDLLYSTKFQVAYFELSYSWVRKIPGRRERLPTPVFLGFPCGSAGKESAHNVGDPECNPWVGKIPWRRERLTTPVFWPGEFHGLYSPWGCKKSDVTELLSLHSLTSLSGSRVKNLPGGYTWDVQYLGWEDTLKEEMATCPNILVWEISWM